MRMKSSIPLRHIIALVALLVVFQNEVRSQTRADESLGFLTGSVLDQKGAVILIPKPVVVIRGSNTVKEITVNQNGRFETSLPGGTYYVTTEIPGFFRFRRAPFRVIAGSSIMINLVLSPRYLIRGTTVSTKKGVDEKAPRPRYEQFQMTPKLSLPGLIEFETKQNMGNHVRYRFAVFSHNHLTIYADEILVNRKAVRLAASGKIVIIEDGQKRIEVKRVVVSFDDGKARLEVIGK